MTDDKATADSERHHAVGAPVQQPVRPAAWMVRQGSRTYYVSDAEFVRSSYDSAEVVPLYGPEALAAESERCARLGLLLCELAECEALSAATDGMPAPLLQRWQDACDAHIQWPNGPVEPDPTARKEA